MESGGNNNALDVVPQTPPVGTQEIILDVRHGQEVVITTTATVVPGATGVQTGPPVDGNQNPPAGTQEIIADDRQGQEVVVAQHNPSSPVITTTTTVVPGVQQPIKVTNQVVCPTGATVVEMTSVITFGSSPPVRLRQLATTLLQTEEEVQPRVARVGPFLSLTERFICASLALLFGGLAVCILHFSKCDVCMTVKKLLFADPFDQPSILVMVIVCYGLVLGFLVKANLRIVFPRMVTWIIEALFVMWSAYGSVLFQDFWSICFGLSICAWCLPMANLLSVHQNLGFYEGTVALVVSGGMNVAQIYLGGNAVWVFLLACLVLMAFRAGNEHRLLQRQV